MVSIVGTFAQNDFLRRLSQNNQADLNTLQAQVSSGKKATTYSDLGETARFSLNLRQTKVTTEAFIKTNTTTNLRLQQMQTILERIKDLTSDMKVTAYAGVSSAATPAAQGNFTVRTAAGGALTEITQLLNSQIDGFYLFAGRLSDAPPMRDPGSVLAAGTPLGNVASLATALPLDSTAASGDALYAAVRDHLDGNAVGAVPGAVPVRYYDGEFSATEQSLLVARIETSTDIAYGVNGRDPAMNTITQALYALSVTTLDPSNEQGYRRIAQRAVADLEAGFNAVVERIGDLGVKQSQLEQVTKRQQDFITTLDLQIGSVEDVDMTEALSKLGATQTQLEASYRMMALLRDLSIVKYL